MKPNFYLVFAVICLCLVVLNSYIMHGFWYAIYAISLGFLLGYFAIWLKKKFNK